MILYAIPKIWGGNKHNRLIAKIQNALIIMMEIKKLNKTKIILKNPTFGLIFNTQIRGKKVKNSLDFIDKNQNTYNFVTNIKLASKAPKTTVIIHPINKKPQN